MIDDQAVAEQLAVAQACVDECADAAIDAITAVSAAVETFNRCHDRAHAAYMLEPVNAHLDPVASLGNITANAVTAERLDLDRILADLVATARTEPTE